MSANILHSWLQEKLFRHTPISISVIDRDHQIVEANRSFKHQFGDFSGRHCYEVYKKRASACEKCPATKTFMDGQVRRSYEKGFNRFGQPIDYLHYTTPIAAKNANKEVIYVVQTNMDITQWVQQEKEHRVLYEWAPCYIAVLDRSYRIIRGNRRLWKAFGHKAGEYCYQVYKNRTDKCADCPAEKTFQDGYIYHAEQTGMTKDGEIAHYIVTSAPLIEFGGRVDQVIEVCMDTTQYKTVQTELSKIRAIQESLITHSYDGIMAIDEQGKMIIFNPALEALLDVSGQEVEDLSDLEQYFPPPLLEIIRERREACMIPGFPLQSKSGEEIPIRFANICLKSEEETLGYASFFQDLREIKQLEREKLDAERLAAVGQTVAGIAHGIKNILMGLEGGLYVARSASKHHDPKLAEEGWRMLENNITKISALIKDFLNFSKGREPQVQLVDPNQIAREVINLYREGAEKAGISIIPELQEGVRTAPMDPQSIHSCLANLVSNAIDACRMSNQQGCKVTLSTREEDNSIIYEVMDNGCGMDYEVKKKVFTTFFSTKGMGGTGLGLLVTRKIVQEHGGKIELDSTPGQGTRFTLIFPRKRLPRPKAEIGSSKSEPT
ncbi:MAG: PAS domain S-box protein [Deltaproteobacteria bacterium]|nr:PAS domain S-box protein [Deltaproteobacteria bacterium]